MLPAEQQDYYNYLKMFRGNHLRGVTLLNSFLMNPARATEIINSLPACAAIFTDYTRSNVDAWCFNALLAYSNYYDTAMMTYLKGNQYTLKNTVTDIMNDTADLISLCQTGDARNVLLRSASLQDLFKRTANFDTFVTDTNKQYLPVFTAASPHAGYVSLINALPAYWNPCGYIQNWCATNGYSVQAWSNWNYIAKFNQILVAGRCTKVISSSTYYVPCVWRYSMLDHGVTLLWADTSTYISTNYNYESGFPVTAYDYSADCLYIFYNYYNNYSYAWGLAMTLTASTNTITFGPTNVLTKAQGQSYFAIMGAHAAAGKCTVVCHNWPALNGNGYTHMRYSTINQNGTYVANSQNMGSYIPSYQGSVLSGDTVYSMSSCPNAFSPIRYYYNNYTYCYVVIPVPNGDGTMTAGTIGFTQYTPGLDYSASSTISMLAMPKKETFAFHGYALNNGGANYTCTAFFYFNGSQQQVSITSASPRQVQIVKHDPFANLFYIQYYDSTGVNTAYYRISKVGAATVTADEFNNALSRKSGENTPYAFLTGYEVPYTYTQGGVIYNIQPSLVSTL